MATLPLETVDRLLKALLVLSRTTDHILEAQAVKDAVDEPLSTSKVQILRLLGQRGSQTSTQVARYLGVTKPAVSQIIDSMVRLRQVTRKQAKHDRREVGLRLTDQGKRMLLAVRRQQRHLLRTALRNSGAANACRWIDTMEQIVRVLAGADQGYRQFCLQCGAHEDGTCVLVGGEANCLFLEHEAKLAERRTRAKPKPSRKPKRA